MANYSAIYLQYEMLGDFPNLTRLIPYIPMTGADDVSIREFIGGYATFAEVSGKLGYSVEKNKDFQGSTGDVFPWEIRITSNRTGNLLARILLEKTQESILRSKSQ